MVQKMDVHGLKTLMDELLRPLGFRRKGNNWVAKGDPIERVVNLQRSRFGNSYYVNYGYIIGFLPLAGRTTHVEKRLGSTDRSENARIGTLLDFDQPVDNEVRLRELKYWIVEKIVSEMRNVKPEDDLLRVLKSMQFRYTVPPSVLEYFKLPDAWE